ncbi:TonB-dependent receptor [Armatimonas rosea]|uniref:Tetratricopeptide (TPR) repeat protein n=1 Tax=Armatimonas rosea TaxID=685828 RepID=A0A7W9SKQ3_ARMRO|nr:tetratricopeptide (TPR) repeat protein [Armatimonas rosea]
MIPIFYSLALTATIADDGISLAAKSELEAAEAAFSKVIETKAPRNVVTDAAIFASLRRYRTAFSDGNTPAAAYCNRAAVRVLRRNADGALADLDQAAANAPDWGLPYLNGALAWLLKGNAANALTLAKTALRLGEDSAQAYAVLAEAEVEAGQLAKAREDLALAEQRDPSLPYLLSVRAKLLSRQSRVVESERTYLQALSQATTVTSDLYGAAPWRRTESAGGILGEGLFRVRSTSSTLRVGAALIRQRVENNAQAFQSRSHAEITLGSPRAGFLIASALREEGGRPGSDSAVFSVPNTPGQKYHFDRLSLVAQRTQALHSGKLTGQVAYRRSRVTLKPVSAPSHTAVADDQVVGEVRWDAPKLTAGAALSRIGRKVDGAAPLLALATPVEPLEQVTPGGATRQSLVYALYRQPLSELATLAIGPVLAGNGKTQVVQPLADLAVKITQKQAVHLRTRPQLVTAASDLFPFAVVAPVQANPIDQDREQASGFNRDPFLLGAGGKVLNHEAVLPTLLKRGFRFSGTFFRRELSGLFAQSVDPRLGSLIGLSRAVGPTKALVLTPVARARTTGLDQGVRTELGKSASAWLGARYQETTLPNVPKWQGALTLDWLSKGWSVTADAFYLGKRPTAITTARQIDQPGGLMNDLVTQRGVAEATAGTNLHLRRALAGGASASLSVYNLGGAQLYPNFSTQTTVIVGLSAPL